jgi:hypothetical protein
MYVSCMPRCRAELTKWLDFLCVFEIEIFPGAAHVSWNLSHLRKSHCAKCLDCISFCYDLHHRSPTKYSKSSQSSIGPWYTNPSPMVMMVCQCFHPSFMSAHTRSEYKVAHSNVGGLLRKHGRKPSAVACRFSLRSSTGFDLHIVWKCNRCIRCM